ncbi:hypothetical protein F1C10_12900 [Sphingomonas sp. NBWT7]|uniref:hypothetical protein n=1 Tax=Sphingomonas sp. NBWT7 TaxID=2596913 RepID=UPI0016238AF5|nr:hypothetical protein [Sphingomonas sp. NBWT7]QNE32735.1 hypothetical protein F1C10_12900 [Sphingomonas sp. NBWT7]
MRARCLFYAITVAALAVMQALLGASVGVLGTLVIIATAALAPLAKRNPRVSDGLFALFCVYFGTASLVVKTLAAQPVQTNLVVPETTATYLLAGFASIGVGYAASHMVRRPSRFAIRLRTITADPARLAWLAPLAFALGALFVFLQTQFRAIASNGGFEGGGFGGFGTFYPLLLLGAGLQAALVAQRPATVAPKALLAAMAIVVLALTLADNTKRTLFDFALVVLVTLLAFRVRMRWRWIVPAAIAAIVAVAFVVPAIQIVRAQPDARGLSRIAATARVIAAARFDPVGLAADADRIAAGFQLTYYDSYVYPRTWNTERFTMIQPIDQVARRLGDRGTMGLADLWRDPAETLLPGFLLRKTLVTAPDRIAWHYGFRARGSIARPVVGLVASSLAALGWVGVLVLPAITVAITFVVLDLATGRMANNAWAAFVFAATAFLAEREVSTTLSFFCRSFPFLLLVGAALLLLDRSHRARRAFGGMRISAPAGAADWR